MKQRIHGPFPSFKLPTQIENCCSFLWYHLHEFFVLLCVSCAQTTTPTDRWRGHDCHLSCYVLFRTNSANYHRETVSHHVLSLPHHVTDSMGECVCTFFFFFHIKRPIASGSTAIENARALERDCLPFAIISSRSTEHMLWWGDQRSRRASGEADRKPCLTDM